MSKTFAVTNFKGAREITLSPTGSLVVIAGANGAGKSSFLDAFVELFDPKGTRLTPKPIHDGEKEARVEYTDEEAQIRVVRTYKKDDAGKLEVFSLDGAKFPSPAAFVAELTGGLIFDPVAFLNLDEKKQRDALLAKVDLPIDLDEVAREKASAEERRRVAGQEVRRLQGALSTLTKPTPGQPTEEVSAGDVLTQIESAQDKNRRRDRAERDNQDAAGAIHDIESQIASLNKELEAARQHKERTWRAVQDLPEPVDLGPLRERLAAVDETNKAVRAAKEYTRTAAELASATGDAEEAQADLDAIETHKRDALAGAQFPVAGLSVDDSGVVFDGIPFVQANTATRLRVAFAIATAGDPQLKLVIVRTGDMLDDISVETFRAIADERGYTVLMERDRDSSREIGFTIVDGELA